MGFANAGHEVTCVDIAPQPDNPFNFVQADALEFLAANAGDFDYVRASPPCQYDCTLTLGTNKHLRGQYANLYGPIRDLMYAIGMPGDIENPAARADWVLCGEMFGLGVLRHRRFELVNWSAPQPAHKKHRGRVRGYRHGEWHDGPYIAAYGAGGGKGSVSEMQEAMGIPWTDDRHSLTEAIPPAYTQAVAQAFAEAQHA